MQNPRYKAVLPEDIATFKRLLHDYTHIPAEQLDIHIHQIVSLISEHPFNFVQMSIDPPKA